MDTDELGHRLLLIGRALYLGALWGVVFAEFTWCALMVAAVVSDGVTVADLLSSLLFSPIAGIVGAIVGGLISLVPGLALALSGSGVLERTFRARLVTGSAAAAVPLAVVVNLSGPLSWWQDFIAVAIATVAATTAVLATPRILDGPPPPARRKPGLQPPSPTTRAEQ